MADSSQHLPCARIDDPVPLHNATKATCYLCGGVVNVQSQSVWAPVGEKDTLKIVHPQHFSQVGR